MKTNWFKVVILLLTILAFVPLQAQKLIKKELNTESDGFQWYKYSYENNNEWTRAAFSLNGKRLTCTTEHTILYINGYFEVWTNIDANGNHVQALYDRNGNCIIPDKYGFTYIRARPEAKQITCGDSMIIDGDYIFSIDGEYYTLSPIGWEDQEEFNANKKPVSTLNNVSNGHACSYYNNSSSSSSNNGILYEGKYRIGDDVYPDGTRFASTWGTMEIQINENEIYLPWEGRFDFAGIENGKRKYTFNADKYLYVNSNYNITVYKYFHNIGIVTSDITRTDSPSSNTYQDQSIYFGGGTNTGSSTGSGTSTPSTGKTAHQVTKMCPLCHGSGKCNTCNGKHWYDGIGGSKITCPNCKPNGACSKCGGSGQVTVTEWY